MSGGVGLRRESIFLDTHLHLYNLSHIGLIVFFNRVLLNKSIHLDDLFASRYGRIIWRIASSDNAFLSVVKKFVLVFLALVPVFASFMISMLLVVGMRSPDVVTIFLAFLLFTVILTFLIFCALSIVKLLVKNRLKAVFNMLSVLENDIASMLLYLERDYIRVFLENLSGLDSSDKTLVSEILCMLKMKVTDVRLKELFLSLRNDRAVKAMSFEKVILTPLMMDFKDKGYTGTEDIYYNLPPDKPIVEQVIDMFNGIKRYMRRSSFRLFEIYPFVGINPGNYELGNSMRVSKKNRHLVRPLLASMPETVRAKVGRYTLKYLCRGKEVLKEYIVAVEDVTGDEEANWKTSVGKLEEPIRTEMIDQIKKISAESRVNSLHKLLFKYFGDYDAMQASVYSQFAKNYEKYFVEGGYNGDVDKIRSWFFAGIKLYPGLGFDPWPKTDSDSADEETRAKIHVEQRKVEFLYTLCVCKNIPITVHCQLTSFESVDAQILFRNTSPDRWRNVFVAYRERFRTLKVDFAHMGINDGNKFIDWIKTVAEYIDTYPNVYADFACKGWRPGFYTELLILIAKHKIKESRVMFGSDFMIHLLYCKSYKQYLENYLNYFSGKKELMQYCSGNPWTFLFDPPERPCDAGEPVRG